MITVHFEAADIEGRPPAAPSETHLALTPSAEIAARAVGLVVQSSLDTFSDLDHARCVVAGRRCLADLDRELPALLVPPSVEIVVRQAAWNIAVMSQRLVRTVPIGDARARDRAGTWRQIESAASLLDILFPRVIASGLGHRFASVQARYPRLQHFVTEIAARLFARRRRAALMVAPHDLKMGFAAAFRAAGVEMIRVRPTLGNTADIADLIALARGTGRDLPAQPAPENDVELRCIRAALRQFGGTFSCPVMRHGWSIYLPHLDRNVAGMLGVARTSSHFARRAKVRAAATYEANGWGGASLMDGARHGGAFAISLNHNSHAPTGKARSDAVLALLHDFRKHAPVVHDSMIWSPSDLGFEHSRPAAARPRIVRCRAPGPASNAPTGTKRRFRILHAGNYQNWSDFFPWIAETSAEFVESLRILAYAVAAEQGIDLVIRLRPKLEVDSNVVRQIIPATQNLSICGVDEDFQTQLARFDLLVSFFSTTVEQALQMGKPVLLWGRSRRFNQLPARRLPPTADDRAAIYAADDQVSLAALLPAIARAHTTPLRPAEYERFNLPAEDPNLARFVAQLKAEHLVT